MSFSPSTSVVVPVAIVVARHRDLPVFAFLSGRLLLFPVRRRLQLPTFRLFLLVSLDVCAARSMLAARRFWIYRRAARAAAAA